MFQDTKSEAQKVKLSTWFALDRIFQGFFKTGDQIRNETNDYINPRQGIFDFFENFNKNDEICIEPKQSILNLFENLRKQEEISKQNGVKFKGGIEKKENESVLEVLSKFKPRVALRVFQSALNSKYFVMKVKEMDNAYLRGKLELMDIVNDIYKNNFIEEIVCLVLPKNYDSEFLNLFQSSFEINGQRWVLKGVLMESSGICSCITLEQQWLFFNDFSKNHEGLKFSSFKDAFNHATAFSFLAQAFFYFNTISEYKKFSISRDLIENVKKNLPSVLKIEKKSVNSRTTEVIREEIKKNPQIVEKILSKKILTQHNKTSFQSFFLRAIEAKRKPGLISKNPTVPINSNLIHSKSAASNRANSRDPNKTGSKEAARCPSQGGNLGKYEVGDQVKEIQANNPPKPILNQHGSINPSDNKAPPDLVPSLPSVIPQLGGAPFSSTPPVLIKSSEFKGPPTLIQNQPLHPLNPVNQIDDPKFPNLKNPSTGASSSDNTTSNNSDQNFPNHSNFDYSNQPYIDLASQNLLNFSSPSDHYVNQSDNSKVLPPPLFPEGSVQITSPPKLLAPPNLTPPPLTVFSEVSSNDPPKLVPPPLSHPNFLNSPPILTPPPLVVFSEASSNDPPKLVPPPLSHPNFLNSPPIFTPPPLTVFSEASSNGPPKLVPPPLSHPNFLNSPPILTPPPLTVFSETSSNDPPKLGPPPLLTQSNFLSESQIHGLSSSTPFSSTDPKDPPKLGPPPLLKDFSFESPNNRESESWSNNSPLINSMNMNQMPLFKHCNNCQATNNSFQLSCGACKTPL